MDFLTPGYLLVAAAAAIPLWLHLRRMRTERRVVFPAIRYLRRARQASARRLRLRDWLLLATRLALVVVAALLAARALVGRGDAQHHPPTRVVLVVDNSASTALVQGDRRLFDLLRERALAAVTLSSPEDRFWVVRGTRPQDAIGPLSASDVAAELRAIEPAAASANLAEAIARATGILSGDESPAEIQVFSDLQVNNLGSLLDVAAPPASPAPPAPPAPPVLVFAPRGDPPPNVAITSAAPARVAAAEGGDILLVVQIEEFVTPAMEGARRELTLRAVVGGRVVSLGSGIPGSAVTLTLRPPPGRWVEGHVEIDPSGLRADDRRFFAVPVRLPTHVALAGVPGPFVEAGLSALESGPRARRVAAPSSADVVWAAQGEGLVEALRDGRRAVVVPGEEPLSIPALNARLERAGVPWRYRHEQESGFTLLGAGAEAVPGLRGRRVRNAYRLEPVGSPDARVWVRLETGAPWVVAAQPPGLGTAILLASPLTERSTDLVTDPAMIPFLDALVNGWPGDGEAGPSGEAQGGVALPARATRVELPSGRRRPVEGGSRFRDLDEAGVYRVLAGDSLTGAFAVNPPASESDLVRATEEDARRRWGTSPILVIGGSESKWRAAIYRARRGREFTAPLLATLLALVLAESGLAAPGAVFRLQRRGKS